MQTNAVAIDPTVENMKKRNQTSTADRIRSYLRHPGSGVLALLTVGAAIVTFSVLIFLVAYILVKGIPYLTPSLFSLEYTSDNVSLMPSLINTFIMTALSLVIAAPLGIFAAIYLVEYAKKRKQTGTDHPYHSRDTFRYSVYRIWSVWYAVFCNSTPLGNVTPGRRMYPGHHGASTYHAYF